MKKKPASLPKMSIAEDLFKKNSYNSIKYTVSVFTYNLKTVVPNIEACLKNSRLFDHILQVCLA